MEYICKNDDPFHISKGAVEDSIQRYMLVLCYVLFDDDQGIQFLSGFRENIQGSGICLAFINMIPKNMHLSTAEAVVYDEQIMRFSTKAVITFGEVNYILAISFRRWGHLSIQRIWITTSQWDAITCKNHLSLDSFHGAISFEQCHQKVSKFRNFIQTMNISKYSVDISQMRTIWNYFNCSVSKTNCSAMSHCSLNTTLEWLSQHRFDMGLSKEGYNLCNAVYVVSHTNHDIIFLQVDSQHLAKLKEIFHDYHQMNYLLNKRVFTNPVGELVDLNIREEMCASYDIYTIWNFPQGFGVKMKIGIYSSYFTQSYQLHISEDSVWVMGPIMVTNFVCSVSCTPPFRKFHEEQKADCNFSCVLSPENEVSNETDMEQCLSCTDDHYCIAEHTHCLQRHVSWLPYEDPLGTTLAFLSLCFSALTALILAAFGKYNDTPIVKAKYNILRYILLICLMFCFLCSLFFIGHPNIVTCILQQTTFGVIFTVVVSTIFAKTITLVLAFKLTNQGRRMTIMLISQAPKFVIPMSTLIQLILCGIWLTTSPPFIDTDTYSEHGQIIIVCNKASVTAFHFVLGYLSSLALGSFSVAFLARNLPDRFNEAKYLTFSMLVFCSVWVTFLPVYHSTKGKVMVAVEVLTFFVSSAGLLVCILFPNCYVILIRPDLNSFQKYRYKLLH